MSVQLTTSLFILFGGIGPIFWASMSDFYHVRRFLYLVSLLIFTVASAGCALVTNIWLLVVLRCIQSVGTSVTMSVGAGTVSDCWEVTERGSAFSVLFVGQFFGPLIGPIIGGGLTTGLGWRSTFWFCFAYGLFLFWFLFTFLPETYREKGRWKDLPLHHQEIGVAGDNSSQGSARSLSAQLSTPSLVSQSIDHPPEVSAPPPKSLHSSSGDSLPSLDSHGRNSFSSTFAHGGMTEDVTTDATPSQLAMDASDPNDAPIVQADKEKSRTFNPFTSILLLRHMFVWMVAIEIGFCFGSMFTIETLIPSLYSLNYDFVSWQTGLSFLGAGLGNLIGSFVSGRLSDCLLKQARANRGGRALTEDRITLNAWPGGIIFIPAGLLLFGWGIQSLLTVWVPIVGFGIVCFGMSQVYSASSAYLVDCIPGRGASVTAASNLFRMSIACVLSLISEPVVAAIGTGFFMVILASLNILGMLLLLVVKFKGQVMRQWAGYGENIA
ncbi:MFS general substrate transporter [Hesseltinella vesiculosa]|uniref:MFS general substrate transporter n=1 Tax=Hesseltinella vesiculosa TaxID=101127 RepID=A0A1X2G526_9FUNG|nr:MFS general substrate transporter [Hesseltinella vesiculosa]